MWPFLAALLSLCALAAYVRNVCMAGTAAILLVNWTVCTLVASLENPFPWMWFFSIDYLSAFTILVMCGRPNRWQAFIGLLYAGQLVAHAGYGLSSQGVTPQYNYWYFLSWSAWAQVLVVAAWGVYAMARDRGLFVRRSSHSQSGTAGASGFRQEP